MRWKYYHKVWAVLVFGWITNYMVRSGLSPVLIPIREEFSLSYAQAGLIGSALFYAYAAMLFPAGYAGDRFGRKLVLVSCSMWWSAASLVTGLAHSFTTLFLARFITGIGQGSYFSNDRPVIAAYTPPEKLGLGQGVSFVGLGTGMCLGYILGGLISAWLGWRYVFFLFSIPSLAASLLILKVIREPQREGSGSGPGPRRPAGFSKIFRSWDLWMLYIGGIPAIYAVWMAGNWVPAMFRELGVESLATSSLLGSLVGISAIPGLIITGVVSDRMVARKLGRKGLVGVEYLALAVFLLLMGMAVRQQWSPAAAAVIIFFVGFFAWGHWAAFYALVADLVPDEVRGTCYGLTNSINFLGSLIAPPVTGWIKDVTDSFEWGCYVAALFIVLGSIFIFLVKPAFHFQPERTVTSAG